MSNDTKDNLLEKKKIEKQNLEKKLEKKLDIALKNRNFEIRLFWQRSNYFLVLNSAIAMAFLSFVGNNYNGKGIPIIMAAFGVGVSILWRRMLFGGKFWQSYWEAKLKKLEESLETTPNPDTIIFDNNTILFDNNEERNHKAVDGFINNKDNEKGWIKKRINKQILNKPSVSNIMIHLSTVFIALWLILLLYTLICTLLFTLYYFSYFSIIS